MPRSCCDCEASTKELATKLESLVGSEYVLANHSRSAAIYLKGARLGHGDGIVVRPGNLKEAVECLQAVVGTFNEFYIYMLVLGILNVCFLRNVNDRCRGSSYTSGC